MKDLKNYLSIVANVLAQQAQESKRTAPSFVGVHIRHTSAGRRRAAANVRATAKAKRRREYFKSLRGR